MNSLAIRLNKTRAAMLEGKPAPVQESPELTLHTQVLEQTEMRAWGQYFMYCAPAAAHELGLSVIDCNDAKLFIAPNTDILAFNRVMGLGSSGAVTRTAIDDIVDTYSYAGAKRFMIQVPPGPAAADIAILLDERGFKPHTNWIKWYRRIEDMEDESQRFDIQQIGRAHAGLYGEIVAEAFMWPDDVTQALASTVGRRDWNHYIAYEDSVPVAIAASHRDGKTGSLSIAATLPEVRGRGAHNALITRRMNDLHLHGVEYAIVETAEPSADNPAKAFYNMQRMGFRRAYARRNWVYTF